MNRIARIAPAALASLAGLAHAQVEHGRMDVEFSPFTFTLDTASADLNLVSPAAGQWNLERGSGAGAFPIGSGVLLTGTAETNAFGSGAENQSFVCSSVNDGGVLNVRTFLFSGLADPNDPNSGPQDNNTNDLDRNIIVDHDFTFGYFPFADGWVAGTALPSNTAANGPLTTMFSSGVALVQESDFASYDGSFAALVDLPDTAMLPFIPLDGSATDKAPGRYALVLPQFNNVHRDGVLLASSPSGESQSVFSVMAQNDNDSYIAPFFDNLPSEKTLQLWVYDVNSFIGGVEADGVSFVYIPYGTSYTVGGGSAQPLPMGFINGSAVIESSQGPVSFELTRTDGDNNGVAWTEGELKVAGLTPDTATLLATPAGGSNQSQDNMLAFRANDAGDGWILQLRDGPTGDEDGLSPEFHAFQFVVLPDGADITPAGPADVPSDRSGFTGKTIAGSWTMETLTGGNGRGTATSDENNPPVLDIVQIGGSDRWELVADNPGDNVFAISGLLASPLLGVNIPQASELGRFDRDGGSIDLDTGIDDRTYKTVIEYAAQNFENRLITESINDGGEINANFVMAHFPVETGFPQQPEVTYLPAQDNDGVEFVPVATASELGFGTDEGVIFARASHNGQKISLVDVDPTRFEMRILWPDSLPDPLNSGRDPVTGLNTDDDRLGWVAMPYSTPGLIAAQVNADGSVANGTGGFTLTQTDFTVDIINADLQDSGVDKTYTGYTLTIPGVDSNTDGILLLQGIGDPTETVASPYPIYANGVDGSFNIVVLDIADRDTALDQDILDEDANFLAPFMFAFVPYGGLPADVETGCNLADLAAPFGVLDLTDIDAFILAFNSGDSAADIAAPFGVIDLTDIDTFILEFFAGCP